MVRGTIRFYNTVRGEAPHSSQPRTAYLCCMAINSGTPASLTMNKVVRAVVESSENGHGGSLIWALYVTLEQHRRGVDLLPIQRVITFSRTL
jgi:hypothetical protein